MSFLPDDQSNQSDPPITSSDNVGHIYVNETNPPKIRHINRSQLSKNITIGIMSAILIILVVADIVIFLLPRSKTNENTDDTTQASLRKKEPTASTKIVPTNKIIPSPTNSPYGTSPTKKPTVTLTKTPTSSPTPINTPTLTPTPRPPTFSDTTYGAGEKVTCTEITGWAVDPQDNGAPASVWLYADGGLYGGIFSGQVSTTITRADINSSKNIAGNHGYTIPVIAPLKDGKEHSLYIYVEGKDGARHQIGNTPQYITCN